MPACNGQLKQLRYAAGLSQNKLARAADLDRTTVSNAERGSDVSELTLSKIAAALSKALAKPVTVDNILKKEAGDD